MAIIMDIDETDIYSFGISKRIINRLRTAAVHENVSESSIVLSVTAALLYRYVGREKIALNVKTADSFTTIEIEMSSNIAAANLFKQTHSKLKEAVKDSLMGRQDVEVELPGYLMRPVMRSINESSDSEATILFQYESAVDKAFGRFTYSKKRYSDELIPQMARHFINISTDATKRLKVRIKDLRMIDPEERKALLERGAGPIVEIAHKCVHELFEEQVEKNPEGTALICRNHRMSYEELNFRANALGHFLQSLGVGPETIVGIGMERSIEAVVCILAILKAGGAYAIVDPEYPYVRINEILSDAQVSLLITTSSLKSRFDYEGLRVINYDQFADNLKENMANVVSDVAVENAAYVTFTSGSTGKPKGIIGIHYGISTLLVLSRFLYKENAVNEVCCLLSPLSFGATVGAIFLPLCNGIPLVIIPDGEEKDPYKFACHIGEHKITNFIATPALVRQLCNLNNEGKKLLNSVKRVGVSGAEVTSDLVRAIIQAMPQAVVSVGYSGSEIGVAAFGRFIEEADWKMNERIPLGRRPAPNMRTYLLDADMNMVPVGVPGELYAAAPYLSRGYVGRPELTARRFIPNPFADSSEFGRMYRTGDILRYRFDDEVEFMGRADSEVKIRGFRIETEEIESVLRNHPAIKEAIVTVDRGKQSERLIVWIVFNHEMESDIPELRRHIKKFLPVYMVPSVFIFTDQLPLNANGKVDRMALLFDAAEQTTAPGNYEKPRNQLESTLISIWASFLSQDMIGIHDNFLDLGGDSIQAGLISLRIRENFNVEIPVIMFFEDMSVGKLAEEIYHCQQNNN